MSAIRSTSWGSYRNGRCTSTSCRAILMQRISRERGWTASYSRRCVFRSPSIVGVILMSRRCHQSSSGNYTSSCTQPRTSGNPSTCKTRSRELGIRSHDHYLHFPPSMIMSEVRTGNVVCNSCGSSRREVDQTSIRTTQQRVPSHTTPYADLPSVNVTLFEAKARSGDARFECMQIHEYLPWHRLNLR